MMVLKQVCRRGSRSRVRELGRNGNRCQECLQGLDGRVLIVLAFDLVSPVLRRNSARLHVCGSKPSPAISSSALSIISCRSSCLSFTSIVLLTPAHWQHQLRRREQARWPFFVDWDWSNCSDYLWLKSTDANKNSLSRSLNIRHISLLGQILLLSAANLNEDRCNGHPGDLSS